MWDSTNRELGTQALYAEILWQNYSRLNSSQAVFTLKKLMSKVAGSPNQKVCIVYLQRDNPNQLITSLGHASMTLSMILP